MAVNSALAYGAVQFHETALFDYRKVLFMVTRFSDIHTPWLDTADTPLSVAKITSGKLKCYNITNKINRCFLF